MQTRSEEDIRAAIDAAAKKSGLYNNDAKIWDVHLWAYDGTVDSVTISFGDMSATGSIEDILASIRESNDSTTLHDACEQRGLLQPG